MPEMKVHHQKKKPLVLVVSGQDPSGAGILADIETCAANGCLALTLITSVTCQNTSSYQSKVDIDENFLLQQLNLLMKEFNPDAIKIGLIPNTTMCITLSSYIREHLSKCPIVLDPVLKTGGDNSDLTDTELPSALRKHMLPLTTVLTPNKRELAKLGETESINKALGRMGDLGAKAILATDMRGDPNIILNILSKGQSQGTVEYVMRRYPESSHGTGCTLSSAIACELAKGRTIFQSVASAQQFAHLSVEYSNSYETQQTIPNRFYWL